MCVCDIFWRRNPRILSLCKRTYGLRFLRQSLALLCVTQIFGCHKGHDTPYMPETGEKKHSTASQIMFDQPFPVSLLQGLLVWCAQTDSFTCHHCVWALYLGQIWRCGMMLCVLWQISNCRFSVFTARQSLLQGTFWVELRNLEAEGMPQRLGEPVDTWIPANDRL